jgi:hypothetical protein
MPNGMQGQWELKKDKISSWSCTGTQYSAPLESGRKTTDVGICALQAQRDFFGSHTYERIDKPGSFHTVWDPRNSADSITTSSYNA